METDEAPDRGRLSIGQLAARTRLPITTLRYYHSVGLLVPAAVDRRSGYRYYDPDQVADAVLAAELRAAGVAPGTIRRVLADPLPARADALRSARAEIGARAAAELHRLARLDALLAGYEEAPPPVQPAVRLVNWAFAPLASTTLCVGAERAATEIRRGIAQLRRQVGRSVVFGATLPPVPAAASFMVQIHAEPAATPLDAPASCAALATRHHGPYSTLWSAYGRLADQVGRAGLTPAGEVVERYLAPLDGQPCTEVLLLLAGRGPTGDPATAQR